MLLLLYGCFITAANLIMQQLGHVKGKALNLSLSSTSWRCFECCEKALVYSL